MIKKYFRILMYIAITITIVTSNVYAKMLTVTSLSKEESISVAKKLDIVPQEWGNEFKDYINREDICKVIYQLLFEEGKTLIKDGTPFSDCDDASVIALYNAHIIHGREEGKFYPTDKLTKAESVEILINLMCSDFADSSNNIFYKLKNNSVEKYNDDELIPNWAYDSVYTAKKFGIIENSKYSEFCPNDFLTREDVLQLLIKIYSNGIFCNKIYDVKYTGQLKGSRAIFYEWNGMYAWQYLYDDIPDIETGNYYTVVVNYKNYIVAIFALG